MTRPRQHISEATKQKAIALFKEGWTMVAIAAEVGASSHSVKEWVDPEYREKRKERRKQFDLARRLDRQRIITRGIATSGPRLPTIRHIEDTRDLTGMICGDPHPDRSALAQRRAHGLVAHSVSVHRI